MRIALHSICTGDIACRWLATEAQQSKQLELAAFPDNTGVMILTEWGWACQGIGASVLTSKRRPKLKGEDDVDARTDQEVHHLGRNRFKDRVGRVGW